MLIQMAWFSLGNLVFPGEKVRIIMSFPANKSMFVFHYHNLEHKDAGMMLNFEIK